MEEKYKNQVRDYREQYRRTHRELLLAKFYWWAEELFQTKNKQKPKCSMTKAFW